MSNIINFQFENADFPVAEKDGQLWFQAAQVTQILGFKNSRQALASHVDKEDVQKLDTLTDGGKQKVSHVNESGLYALIFGSTKPEAKVFKRWVTSEVLPAIRKTGSYTTKTTPAEREGLRAAVNYLVGKRHLHFDEAYRLVHQRFNVGSIEDIPADTLPQAVAYCHALALDTSLHGEVIDNPSPMGGAKRTCAARRCPARTDEGRTLDAVDKYNLQVILRNAATLDYALKHITAAAQNIARSL